MFYLLSFWELDVSQVHILMSENIKKGSQEITVSFYYLIQNINVEGVTTTTGRHGIAEILLKVALKRQKSKSNQKTKLMTSHR
jgi:ferritin-like protein